MTEVTTIIPAYNCAAYIAQALKSALEESENAQVLVIDDASDEDIPRALGRLTEDHRVTYLRNEKNLGVAETRNRGIALAKTPYIAFLDGDDFWRAGKLAAQCALLEKTGAPLTFTARELFTADGNPTGRVIEAPERLDYETLLHSNLIPCGSVLMKTEIASEFRFINDKLHEDYILWLKTLQTYGDAYGINEPYLCCRLSEGGKSRNKLKSAKMHYGSLRHVGISRMRAARLTVDYAVAGVKKYHL